MNGTIRIVDLESGDALDWPGRHPDDLRMQALGEGELVTEISFDAESAEDVLMEMANWIPPFARALEFAGDSYKQDPPPMVVFFLENEEIEAIMEALDEAEFGSGFPCRDFQAAVRRVNNRAGIVIN